MSLKKNTAVTLTVALILSSTGAAAPEAAAMARAQIGAVRTNGIVPGAVGGAAGVALNAGEGIRLVPAALSPAAGLPSVQGVSADAVSPAMSVESAVPGMEAAATTVPQAQAALPSVKAAANAAVRLGQNEQLQVITRKGAKGGVAARSAALDRFFENSMRPAASETPDVAGRAGAVRGDLAAPSALRRFGDGARGEQPRAAAVEEGALKAKNAAGSDLLTTGAVIVGGLFMAGMVFSSSFRGYMKRLWQLALGALGIGVKNAEKNNPELLAQRIIDQLNAAKPEYARKVAEASKLTESIRIQIRNEKAKHAELEKTITALLTDDNEENDVYAATMLAQQKALTESIASSEEQLKLAETSLEEIKADRVRFFHEREQMLAEINAMLTRNKQAEMKKKMAELKGSFDTTDLRGNMDRLKDIVDDNEAEASGMRDATDSNPDEVIRKAKDDLMSAEVKAEIAKRKAALKAKQSKDATGKNLAGSDLVSLKPVLMGALSVAGGIYAGLATGELAAVVGVMVGAPAFGLLGAIGLGILSEKLGTSGGKTLGMAIWGGLIGLIGGGVLGYYLGASVAAPWAAAVLGTAGLVNAFFRWVIARVSPRDGDKSQQGKDAAGSDLLTTGAVIVGGLFMAGMVFSSSFRGYMKRLWQLALGALGIGVKNAEKNNPELLAQRIIDQLNAAKPEYNRRVAEASKLVEKLRIQVRNQEEKYAELDKTITALLADDDESNDVLTAGMIAQQKLLAQSTTATKEQVNGAQAALAEIKADRVRFFHEREQMLAEINAMLTRNKQAEMKKKMAELKGSFDTTDLRGNMDRLKDIVDDNEAEASGMRDATDSNPDEVIRKAKDDLMSAEVKAEIAKRKAALKEKRDGAQSAKDLAGSDLLKISPALIALLSVGLLGAATVLLGQGLFSWAAALGAVPAALLAASSWEFRKLLGPYVVAIVSVFAGFNAADKKFDLRVLGISWTGLGLGMLAVMAFWPTMSWIIPAAIFHVGFLSGPALIDSLLNLSRGGDGGAGIVALAALTLLAFVGGVGLIALAGWAGTAVGLGLWAPAAVGAIGATAFITGMLASRR